MGIAMSTLQNFSIHFLHLVNFLELRQKFKDPVHMMPKN